MYASYIHASGSRLIDVRIIHTFIKIKAHRCMHHTYMHQDQGSYMYASYIHASRSRIICMDTYIMDTSAWVTRPERPKGAKDEVKEARRAAD